MCVILFVLELYKCVYLLIRGRDFICFFLAKCRIYVFRADTVFWILYMSAGKGWFTHMYICHMVVVMKFNKWVKLWQIRYVKYYMYADRLLDSLVVECWLRVWEVPGSIPSQGPRNIKDVIKMVPVVPLFSTQHWKGKYWLFLKN